jgi:hypothetical protein
MEGGSGGPQRRKRRPAAGAEAGRPVAADRSEPPGPEPVRPASGGPEPVRLASGGSDRVGPDPVGPEPARRGPSRSELRNQAVRAELAPLAPGERPAPLLAAVAVAGLLGAGNAIAYAAGAKISGHHPGVGVLSFSAVMALLAGGMWTRRYLAVLAFEALLAIAVLLFTLFLVEASNVEGLLLAVAVIVGGGWLFWKLVRVMGRLAAPRQSSP